MKWNDWPDFNVASDFDTAANFIHESLNKGESIVVHCFAGRSRSVTAIMAYLIKYKNMSVDKALLLIKQAQPQARPNPGFISQLRTFESEFA
jgi:protein-tyrosine phosphatase